MTRSCVDLGTTRRARLERFVQNAVANVELQKMRGVWYTYTYGTLSFSLVQITHNTKVLLKSETVSMEERADHGEQFAWFFQIHPTPLSLPATFVNSNNLGHLLFARKLTQALRADRVLTQFRHSRSTRFHFGR